MFLVKFIIIALLALPSSVADGTRCTNKVTKFQYRENFFGRIIDLNLSPNPIVIDLGWSPLCEITFVAVTESSPPGCNEGSIRCVKLWLGDDYSNKERVPPYSLYGDDNGVFDFDRPKHLGIQTLRACPYTDNDCTRGRGTCLEVELDITNPYLPNFVLYDAALGWCCGGIGRIDYVYDGQPICLPKSGEVTMIANTDCYVEKAEFKLTGGGRLDTYTDYERPFFLYGNTGVYGSGEMFGKDGFEIGTEYTVSAIYDDDPSQKVERRFTFKQC